MLLSLFVESGALLKMQERDKYQSRLTYMASISCWKYLSNSFRFDLNVGVSRPFSTENNSQCKCSFLIFSTNDFC